VATKMRNFKLPFDFCLTKKVKLNPADNMMGDSVGLLVNIVSGEACDEYY
jgi:hypothetical protein